MNLLESSVKLEIAKVLNYFLDLKQDYLLQNVRNVFNMTLQKKVL